MAKLTRRALLQSGAALSAAAATQTAAPVEAQAAAAPVAAAGTLPSPRDRLLLDFGWRFHFGHADDAAKDFGFGNGQGTYAKSGRGVTTAGLADYDDSSWQAVNLPHDWAVELPFARTPGLAADAPRDPLSSHGFKPLGRDFPETSIGWYRRVFEVPASDLGRRLSLEFDGVFRNAMVLFNGHIVATNQSGYAPFSVDVSDWVTYGGKNAITVRVDATLGEGWFYEGAGIYRHVWLVKTDPLHIPQWGVLVRSDVKGRAAHVSLATEIFNAGDDAKTCHVVSTIRDAAGKAVKTVASAPVQVAPQALHVQTLNAVVNDPALWSIETPHLYNCVSEIVVGGKVVDSLATNFGIRTIRFDADKGFFLNGKPVKLKGSCNHQDHAGLGSALPDRIHAYRIERLKDMASNAYRSSHNPPAPELLDACDRLGMMVIDETRMMSSDAEGISQLTRMIRRDRNHPSVILWSIGNEEPQEGTELGARVARSMKKVCTALDPTRPITAAMDHDWGHGISPVLDVVGFNYRIPQVAAFHAANPKQPIIGTETSSTFYTRGIYARDNVRGFTPAYDTDFPNYSSTASAWWNIVGTHDYIGGGFIWTGFDYRGEPSPFGRWPNASSQYGNLDTCGFAKDNFYYYKAWWDSAPLLHLFPHWNWAGKEGKPINVWCHTNLDSVELFLNGKSLGSRTVVPNNHIEWDVPYAPGTLEAKGYKNGQQVLSAVRETAGPAAGIKLTADRSTINADGEDASVITVEIVDAQGRMVPEASDLVSFNVSGGGAVIGVGNGDPTSHEADKAQQRKAFNGLCSAIVQASKTAGTIRIDATAPGLTAGSVTVTAAQVQPRPAVA